MALELKIADNHDASLKLRGIVEGPHRQFPTGQKKDYERSGGCGSNDDALRDKVYTVD